MMIVVAVLVGEYIRTSGARHVVFSAAESQSEVASSAEAMWQSTVICCCCYCCW